MSFCLLCFTHGRAPPDTRVLKHRDMDARSHTLTLTHTRTHTHTHPRARAYEKGLCLPVYQHHWCRLQWFRTRKERRPCVLFNNSEREIIRILLCVGYTSPGRSRICRNWITWRVVWPLIFEAPQQVFAVCFYSWLLQGAQMADPDSMVFLRTLRPQLQMSFFHSNNAWNESVDSYLPVLQFFQNKGTKTKTTSIEMAWSELIMDSAKSTPSRVGRNHRVLGKRGQLLQTPTRWAAPKTGQMSRSLLHTSSVKFKTGHDPGFARGAWNSDRGRNTVVWGGQQGGLEPFQPEDNSCCVCHSLENLRYLYAQQSIYIQCQTIINSFSLTQNTKRMELRLWSKDWDDFFSCQDKFMTITQHQPCQTKPLSTFGVHLGHQTRTDTPGGPWGSLKDLCLKGFLFWSCLARKCINAGIVSVFIKCESGALLQSIKLDVHVWETFLWSRKVVVIHSVSTTLLDDCVEVSVTEAKANFGEAPSLTLALCCFLLRLPYGGHQGVPLPKCRSVPSTQKCTNNGPL